MTLWVLSGLSVGTCIDPIERHGRKKPFAFFFKSPYLALTLTGEIIYPNATVAANLFADTGAKILQSSNMDRRLVW